jgi:FkbM family methyltransferase
VPSAIDLARRTIPKRVRGHLRAAVLGWDVLPLASDLSTLRNLHRLQSSASQWGPGEERIPLRLRPLKGAEVFVRPRTADIFAVRDTFLGRYHLPPQTDGSDAPIRIWDLGANIGLTAAHLAVLFPNAGVTAVEMDASNADLLRRNLAPLADRCETIEAAVWPHDGQVHYRRERGGELGYRAADTPSPGSHPAPALTLDALAAGLGEAPVDFVKMDIEGAEERVLRENTRWARRARAIKVEVHPPYDTSACRRDLEALGFRTSLDDRHGAAVLGVRD